MTLNVVYFVLIQEQNKLGRKKNCFSSRNSENVKSLTLYHDTEYHLSTTPVRRDITSAPPAVKTHFHD